MVLVAASGGGAAEAEAVLPESAVFDPEIAGAGANERSVH